MMVMPMPDDLVCDHSSVRGKLLEKALAPFVEEMRLMECSDLLAHVAREQFANLDDLIQSSLELIYRSGVFAFGWGAALVAGWHETPCIELDMELCFRGVTAFFVLEIGGERHRVIIRCISFDDPSPHPGENTRRLQHALSAAQLDGQASGKAV